MDGNQQTPQPPSTSEEQRAAEADRQARIDYLQNINQSSSKRSMPTWLKVLLGVLVLLLLIAGAMLVFGQSRDNNVSQDAQKKAASSKAQAEDTSIGEPKRAFESSDLKLGFKHPENWKVATNTDSNQVTATSAPIKMTDANGGKITGQVIMTISPKGQNLEPFKTGNATAVLDSKKVKYTSPTDVQRGETYITFAQYASTTTRGALDGVYITGDYGYQRTQIITRAEAASLDPLVMYSFNKCADSTCSQAKPTSIKAGSWQDKGFGEPLEKIFQSITVN